MASKVALRYIDLMDIDLREQCHLLDRVGPRISHVYNSRQRGLESG